jgi:maleate isomerase
MYGWRGRIGLLVPATNSTCESEFRILSSKIEGLAVYVARVPGPPGPVSKEWEIDFGKHCTETAIRVSSVEPGVIAVANTSGTVINDGMEIARDIEKATKIPAVTTNNAVIESLRRLNVNRIGVVTPYPPDFNEYLKEFLIASGMQIIDFSTRHTSDILTIGRYYPSLAYDLSKKLQGDFEAIFISCTDFRTIDIIQAVEDDMGVPVISSNLATFSEAIRKIKIRTPIDDYGRLLKLG